VIKNPKKLNQKMKKLSLKEEESAEDDDEDILSDKEFDSLDDDDVFFETKLENKSKQEVSLNLREFSKHLPINSASLKTRGKRAINLKFCCSINYFLYSLWSSAKLNPNFFVEIELRQSKDDLERNLFNDIFEIINLIENNDWAKAQFHWLNKCIGLTPTIISNKSSEINCYGTLFDLFLKKMQELQKYRFIKAQCPCRHVFEENLRSELNMEIISEFHNKELKYQCKCNDILPVQIKFEKNPLWLIAEMPAQHLSNAIDIRTILTDLNFDANNKFQLLCIIVFIKADKQNGLKIDHFNGIYNFNKTYYLVDDLNSNEVYSIKEYDFVISAIIYTKID
jgi:hypothetical protein